MGHHANAKQEKWVLITLSLLVFLVCILFFQEHPFIFFDGDDMLYSTYWRKPIVLPETWNPIKVFPELAMTLSMHTASTLIMPLTGDFVDAVKITNSFIVSLAIAVYVSMFFQLLRSRAFTSVSVTAIATILFFICHFLIFRRDPTDNPYMFWVYNVNCVYHYLIPNLLCASLVMYFMKTNILDGFFENRNLLRKAIVLLLLYLALCSNLYCNIILASYVGICLIANLIKTRHRHENRRWHRFFQENIACLLILVAWFILLYCEAAGGRADVSSATGPSLSTRLSSTLEQMTHIPIDHLFAIIGVGSIIVYVLTFALIKRARRRLSAACLSTLLLSGLLTGIYIILLCTAVDPTYITRPDTTFGFFFYVIAFIAFTIAVLLKQYPRFVLVAPLVLLLCAAQCNTSGKTFSDSIYGGLVPVSATSAEQITKDSIATVVEASENNMTSVELKVPDFGRTNNWPISVGSGSALANTLLGHGVIDKPIAITIIPDSSLNQKYDIPLPPSKDSAQGDIKAN